MDQAQRFLTFLATGLTLATGIGILASATLFSVATGVGAYIKGRLPGSWMLAGFFLGPFPFLVLLLHSDE
ncbi:MAG TPA: hypothetical protein VIJ12_02365 [Candidatus Baltobacteraceae bacterium]